MYEYDQVEFASPSVVLSSSIVEAIKPPRNVTVSQWAAESRILVKPAAKAGPWDNEYTPYLVEIMDELSPQSRTQTVTFIKGRQVGGTECGNNWMGAVIDVYKGSMLYVTPTEKMYKDNSKTRIQPMIDACEGLRETVRNKASREAGNSVNLKQFDGGYIMMGTSKSASNLRSQPIQFLFMDELSDYEQDVDNQGDPVELAKGGTVSFGKKRKIYQVSTPSIFGECRIEAEFNKSDKRYYHVPCVHCRKKFVISWDLIKYQKDEEGHYVEGSAFLECPHCSGRIEEHLKSWFLSQKNGAEWIPTAKGEGSHAGFHLSSLYSPYGMLSWGEIAKLWISANERVKHGDVSQLKAFTNQILGETWKLDEDTVDPIELWEDREQWGLDYDVPQDAAFISIGADVQKDRIEATVYAWGDQDECYGIEHRVFYGNPPSINDETWTRLEELIYQTEYRHESGAKIAPSIAFVDSGHWSDTVYEFVMRNKQRKLLACRGSTETAHPIVMLSKSQRFGKRRIAITLALVGGFACKQYLYNRAAGNRDFKTLHYPVAEDFDKEFFKQLTGEVLQESVSKGRRIKRYVEIAGQRVEALDCWQYAFAAYKYYQPNMEIERSKLGIKTDNQPKPETEEPKEETPIAAQSPRARRVSRRASTNWATDW